MKPSPTIQLSRCWPWDGPAVRSVIHDTWIATYASIMGLERAQETAKGISATEVQWLMFVGWFGAHVSLKATSDGRTVGFAFANCEDDGAVILYALYVLPAYQGLGIGTQLLRAVETHWPKAWSIRLEALSDNTSAIRWYNARGYDQFGSTPNATRMSGIAAVYLDKTLAQPKPTARR